MFRQAWDQRLAQADDAMLSGQRKIKTIEKQIEALLARIIEATNTSVIQAYEGKIANLDRTRPKLEKQLENSRQPRGTFEEKLEPALQFLASSSKFWESGQATLRRTVLRPAFTERLAYHRIEGARTPKISLPFKLLKGDSTHRVRFGAAGGTILETDRLDSTLHELEEWDQYIKAEPEMLQKLQAYADAASGREADQEKHPASAKRMPGPSL